MIFFSGQEVKETVPRFENLNRKGRLKDLFFFHRYTFPGNYHMPPWKRKTHFDIFEQI